MLHSWCAEEEVAAAHFELKPKVNNNIAQAERTTDHIYLLGHFTPHCLFINMAV